LRSNNLRERRQQDDVEVGGAAREPRHPGDRQVGRAEVVDRHLPGRIDGQGGDVAEGVLGRIDRDLRALGARGVGGGRVARGRRVGRSAGVGGGLARVGRSAGVARRRVGVYTRGRVVVGGVADRAVGERHAGVAAAHGVPGRAAGGVRASSDEQRRQRHRDRLSPRPVSHRSLPPRGVADGATLAPSTATGSAVNFRPGVRNRRARRPLRRGTSRHAGAAPPAEPPTGRRAALISFNLCARAAEIWRVGRVKLARGRISWEQQATA